jgi:negative regulator of genetic competence, sporulation and motility
VQIKKINNNKLKVFLNSNDLNKKNIDVDSFLSNSIESQDLFFEILDLAEEKYDFIIENNKAVVETISLDNNIFVLTITKLKNIHENTSENSSKIFLNV